MKKTIFKLVSIVVLIFLLVVLVAKYDLLKEDSTAFAIGDLTVNWGVPPGNPIFNVSNLAPGDMQSHTVNVVNNAPTLRPVGVRGIKTLETNNLSDVLKIVISDGVTDLYGGGGTKTLAQFFVDSGGPTGIFLADLNPGNSKNYTFKVTFDQSASNQFQNSNVVFDLQIGIAIDVPPECAGITFSGPPIFGTAGNDNLTGTPGNDLIFALEGNDKVEGNSGDDCIVGGPGNDRLNGNLGSDVILGGEGDDTIYGNNGDDKIYGGGGNDDLNGENGNDTLIGGEGTDKLDGGNGTDTCSGEIKKSCEL